ncbi:succinyl-CoA synthetase-like protein [Annulohypoxylon maeteangense]|uniref:succinyl-CoA synthetase-like protein n=1 Tax=Annulohypoxylon maeteangense TaxID=1927788 RepID=UPI0020075335|nr:succinyl-CoA synthetase-like protein [Annulohypoxylon maeteangense]KAI0880355.1 succinyl-CoA synthetase-like protein [Annulohypoxylon maeteangense]
MLYSTLRTRPLRCLSIASSRNRNLGSAGSAWASFESRRHSSDDVGYDSTLRNLKIGSHTRVIFQGFTGRQATANARESLAWGTKIVGGVTPGRDGEHLGLPLYPTVRDAVKDLKPDATAIYVAAQDAINAVEEAIEAEVPLIVAVAEHIPVHDMLRLMSILKTQSKCRLIGANSPGIISVTGKCRIGFQPLPCFKPGRVGIVARSGTLSYEAAASTLRAGLGQSMCIGIGGDIVPGTTIKEGLQILLEDKDTDAIALIGEIGGNAELEITDMVRRHLKVSANPKPIAALVGGINAPPGRTMGHSGAFTLPGDPSVRDKIKALTADGAVVVNHPSRFGPVLKSMLDSRATAASGVTPGHIPQQRAMHTLIRRPPLPQNTLYQRPPYQRRSIYIPQETCLAKLREHNVPVSEGLDPDSQKMIALTINRSAKNLRILASPTRDISEAREFDFPYAKSTPDDVKLEAIIKHIQLDPKSKGALESLINELLALFIDQEYYLAQIWIVETPDASTKIQVAGANFGFEIASSKGCGRHTNPGELRNASTEDPDELAAEKDGIVYIKLKDGNIGTLVNGAGLAMNTVDALADAGGKAANFLDTGGKATSLTVKKSFEFILKDPRVKCVFVNIFGGLTRGDMIAEGVIMAFKELKMSVPVVVRIRGTNEKEGQDIIAQSGLPLYAFDDFDEAAAKAIELVARD